MFPARAGMSLKRVSLRDLSHGVPRASGDEPPAGSPPRLANQCSPRERG